MDSATDHEIPADLLDLLRCPATRQPLRLAPAEVLAKLAGDVKSGLLRADGKVLYPIRDGIPMLLIEEGIALE